MYSYIIITLDGELRLWTLCGTGVSSSCVCLLSLRQIVTKQSRSVTLRLQNRTGRGGLIRNLGEITVHAEETAAAKSAVEMIFRCSHLDNKDVFSKSVYIQYPETFMFYFKCITAYLFIDVWHL